mmetsp:Transcript_28051/g.69387  ORF Transcript_28051/g.69387 Transcript_28051/m.69387 type:complete len:273 (+) Transcript_28051:489-1307(+)
MQNHHQLCSESVLPHAGSLRLSLIGNLCDSMATFLDHREVPTTAVMDCVRFALKIGRQRPPHRAIKVVDHHSSPLHHVIHDKGVQQRHLVRIGWRSKPKARCCRFVEPIHWLCTDDDWPRFLHVLVAHVDLEVDNPRLSHEGRVQLIDLVVVVAPASPSRNKRGHAQLHSHLICEVVEASFQWAVDRIIPDHQRPRLKLLVSVRTHPLSTVDATQDQWRHVRVYAVPVGALQSWATHSPPLMIESHLHHMRGGRLARLVALPPHRRREVHNL